jgi:Xaa-Pro aminopeptidase
MNRLGKLQKGLREGALLIGSAFGFDANAYYYFGCESACAILVTRDEAYSFAPREVDGTIWGKAKSFTKKQLPKFIREHKIKKLAFDENSSLAFAAINQHPKVKLAPYSRVMRAQRMVKDANELKLLKRAQSVTKKCVREVLDTGVIGKTGNLLAGELELKAREQGTALNSFEPIVLVNAEARDPHGTPSNKRIRRGDLVLFDVGATWKRYHGDYSYTHYEGGDELKRSAVNAVKESKRAAERAVRVGIRGSELANAALAILKERGFAKTSFKAEGLGLGHHIGLEVHEGERLEETRLRKGMAFTIEPGVYTRDFGVRFEDVVLL